MQGTNPNNKILKSTENTGAHKTKSLSDTNMNWNKRF
jgi:hypothetical protein